MKPNDLISKADVVKECERFLDAVKGRQGERADGAFVAMSRLARNLKSLPAVQPAPDAAVGAAQEIVDDHLAPCAECFGDAMPDVQRAIESIITRHCSGGMQLVTRIKNYRDRYATVRGAEAATIRMICDRLLGGIEPSATSGEGGEQDELAKMLALRKELDPDAPDAIVLPAQSPRVSEAWQPIATAPKDGTEVLLGHGNSVWLDTWLVEDGIWMMCDQWTDPETPSHWQPAPSPPIATKD